MFESIYKIGIKMKNLILASISPRQHELLNLIGIKHLVKPCEEKEFPLKKASPDFNSKENDLTIEEQVISIAKNKALCVAKTLSQEDKAQSIILGADTIVFINGEIIGKPTDKNHAFVLLEKLSGKTHKVYTGLYLYNCESEKSISGVEMTKVKMALWTKKRLQA